MKTVILSAFATTVCMTQGFGQVSNDANTSAKIQAIFMYNFTKYIEWPAESVSESFVIGVFGNTRLVEKLTEMAGDTRKYRFKGKQAFSISKYSSVDAIGNCQMLFISRDKSDNFSTVLKKMKGRPVLILSESDGLISQGSAINFIAKNNKQEFELNPAAIKQQGLSVSSSLNSFAIKVY